MSFASCSFLGALLLGVLQWALGFATYARTNDSCNVAEDVVAVARASVPKASRVVWADLAAGDEEDYDEERWWTIGSATTIVDVVAAPKVIGDKCDSEVGEESNREYDEDLAEDVVAESALVDVVEGSSGLGENFDDEVGENSNFDYVDVVLDDKCDDEVSEHRDYEYDEDKFLAIAEDASVDVVVGLGDKCDDAVFDVGGHEYGDDKVGAIGADASLFDVVGSRKQASNQARKRRQRLRRKLQKQQQRQQQHQQLQQPHQQQQVFDVAWWVWDSPEDSFTEDSMVWFWRTCEDIGIIKAGFSLGLRWIAADRGIDEGQVNAILASF
mmetsp:Transcript_54690/g.138093  ORF Transcript_54690/g.138093 Transcript_54690/m.138093 type:complete len:327 (-) Transcript_54690:213-1193(-)